jgi:hypothetical protein
MIRMAILENECRRDTRLCLERGNVEYCQITIGNGGTLTPIAA